MSKTPARRTRVEKNIYKRSDGKTFEVGYRDSTGRQRWEVVSGGIMSARARRDAILGAKGQGEVVQPNLRLRFGCQGRLKSDPLAPTTLLGKRCGVLPV
jgi:hypothetical protein